MGYDIHITRRDDWTDEGDDITAREWLEYVDGDDELTIVETNGTYFAAWNGALSQTESWLDWSDGQIFTKNPDNSLIDKMIKIAGELRAEVQGDDGEIYDEIAGDQTRSYQPRKTELTFLRKLTTWLKGKFVEPEFDLLHDPLPFDVGDRVRDAWGENHTVISIDPNTAHGLGAIRIKSEDGKETTLTMVAHGLTPIVEE